MPEVLIGHPVGASKHPVSFYAFACVAKDADVDKVNIWQQCRWRRFVMKAVMLFGATGRWSVHGCIPTLERGNDN